MSDYYGAATLEDWLGEEIFFMKVVPHFIVTRNPNYQYQPGALVARALEDALRWASLTPTDEIMVAGGGEIYQQTLPHAKRVLMTKFDHVVQGADTYFPTPEESEWVETKIKDGETSQPELPFSFWEYNRRG